MLLTSHRIDRLVTERLGGDRARLPELFETREVFEWLKASADPSDWLHFEPMTFDGEYLVETQHGFMVYYQERGAQSGLQRFQSLRDAAQCFFAPWQQSPIGS